MKYNALETQVSAMDNYIETQERIRAALSQSIMYIYRARDFSSRALVHQSWQHVMASRHANKAIARGHETSLLAGKNEHIVIPPQPVELRKAAVGM